jgi:hypothetical protein
VWRELEVELTGGTASLLDAVEQRLVFAGARRSASASKLQHVLGAADAPPDGPQR